jgi:protein-L-isoaspartate(D-aspartate) O-methyltransferase
MPRDQDDSRLYRRALVETLRRDGHLGAPRVAAALLAVPRETFLPGVALDEVYRPSDAIVIKRLDGESVSSASAPEVVALMLEQLDPQPGDHILEIGAGSGYNAALLAHMVGETGRVVSLDIDDDLVLAAREHLAAAGYPDVSVVQADGALGYPAEYPYDGIILTVASSDIAPAWYEQLARPGGRLVMPVALRALQRCVVFAAEPGDADCLVTRSLRPCSFISLRGLLGRGPPRVPLDPEGSWVLVADQETLPLTPQDIAALLSQPLRTWRTGISANVDELRMGLHLWLVAHEPRVFTLWAGSQLPDLFG